MKKTKPTVMYAVCAYNEAENIQKHLKSVLSQNTEGFIFEKILVVCDGSKDNTAKLVKSLKNKKIELWDYKERVGKSSRLNQIYNCLKADLLIQSDADVILADKNVIKSMVGKLTSDAEIMMCGGNPVPLPSRTFTEKAVNITTKVYRPFRHSLRGGNNIFSADGRMLGYKKEFIKKVTVPSTMIANDAFTYFECISRGLEYRFVPQAKVYYRSPQTLKDQIRQNTRFIAAHVRMEKYFSEDLVKSEISIPSNIFWLSAFKQFIKFPIHCVYIFLINFICRIESKIVESKLTAKWSTAYSTKIVTSNNQILLTIF